MRAWIAVLLITPALVGCIGSDSEPTTPTSTPTADVELPENVDVYGANGSSPGPNTSLVDRVGETVYNLTGFSGAEPTMGITESGAVFATAGDKLIRSTDDGGTWTVVNEIGEEVEGTPGDIVYRSWDPLMHVDPVTDTVYFDPMFPPLVCTELQFSTDDGESWTQNPPACHPPPMDHQKFFTAEPGPDAPPAAGAAHETVLYQCYNALAATNCAVSYDNGKTWPIVQPVADRQTGDCGGINGFGAGAPDGVAAVPLQSGCEKATIAVTTDSGLTWELREVPNATGVEPFDPEVKYDDSGDLFLVWRGSDQHTYLARSSDHGQGWAGPWDITPPEVESTIFNSISVTGNGTIGVAFLGTEDTDKGPNDAPEDAIWNLHMVTSRTAGTEDPRFTSYQVTADEDPVQVGRICTGGVGCGEKRNLLEFIDTAIHPDGTFHAIYTEGCVEECAEEPEGSESTARQVAWAHLSGIDLHEPVRLDVDADASAEEPTNETGNDTGNGSSNGSAATGSGWLLAQRT